MKIYIVPRPVRLVYHVIMTLGRCKAIVEVQDTFAPCSYATVVPRHCTMEVSNSSSFGSEILDKSYEVTPEQRLWLFSNHACNIMDRLTHSMYYHIGHHSKGSRFQSVMNTMAERLQNIVKERPTFYHRDHFINSNASGVQKFSRLRKYYKKLGELVRQAIRERDTNEVSNFLVENNEFLRSRTFNRILVNLQTHQLDLAVVHTDCDHYVHEDDVHYIGRRENTPVCQGCFEDNVSHCEDGDYFDYTDNLYYHESDGNYYSYEEDDDDHDDDDQDPSYLMNYSANVLDHLNPDDSIVSSTHGNFLMGIELEMCKNNISMSDAVHDVRTSLGEDYCILKSDGSLPDGGMEVVTAPRGLAEHIKRFTEWNINSDYRAWNTGKCGMHIHIHSKAFTGLTLGKFLMLVNSDANALFIRHIAGRHPLHDSQARDYCASESQEVLDNPVHAIKGKSSSRYRMVNCENLTRSERDRLGLTCEIFKSYNTIELRIFRASLKKARLLAQIEFAHALVMFCRVASWRDLIQTEYREWSGNRNLKQPSFIKWLKNTNNQYPHLCDWYGIRRRPNAKNAAPTSPNSLETLNETSSN